MSQGSEFPVFELFGWKCGVLICFDNNLRRTRGSTLCKDASYCLRRIKPEGSTWK